MAAAKKESRVGTIVVVLLLLAGTALLYWFFFLKPALSGIGELRAANGALEQEIGDLKQKLAQKSEIENRWREVSDKEAHLLSRIPQRSDLPQVLGALEGLVLGSGLGMESFGAGEFQEGEGYRFVPISLRVVGEPEALLQLLKQLEQFTHMTLTEQAGLDRSGESHRLDVNFNLIFIPEG